ncbi:glycosyltransferase [Vibrio sp. Isolate34]|uniref:glycosyltransferase family 2 protein n=1 Tax=Vibrio sp. Isolate34 TaxID=2908540 RepID=UPI001EFD3447|nr:glycosyltransferase [Vibrio sp. Isolate34]MCG9639519.1 glycosyltransferase [Vibrio sp. Isolate34]
MKIDEILIDCPDSQSEIMKHWHFTDRVYVSIVCTSYNQVDYIESAVKSFLAQEVEYKFEVIIHDDKSSDGTLQLLIQLKNKFPDIIKLITQDENQYSIYPLKPLENCFAAAAGNYVAICEGDDFWTDKRKLSKQLNVALHSNYKMVAHGAYCLNENEIVKSKWNFQHDELYTLDDVFMSEGQLIPTASYFIDINVLREIPDWLYKKSPIGDFFFEVFSCINGENIYVSSEFMSCYRVHSSGSWSERNQLNLNNRLKFNESFSHVISNLEQIYPNINELSKHKCADEYYRTSLACFRFLKIGLAFKYLKKAYRCHYKFDAYKISNLLKQLIIGFVKKCCI